MRRFDKCILVTVVVEGVLLLAALIKLRWID